MQQRKDPMIAIHQELIGSFDEHEDNTPSTQVEDDEVVVESPSTLNVNTP